MDHSIARAQEAEHLALTVAAIRAHSGFEMGGYSLNIIHDPLGLREHVVVDPLQYKLPAIA
jgi:hypothetical protein